MSGQTTIKAASSKNVVSGWVQAWSLRLAQMDRPNSKTLDWRLTNLFFCLLNHDCTCMSVGLYFFSMLVNVYGSKDLFVSEYRTLLADRILSSFNYDTEKEVIACTFVFVYQFVKLFSMWGITFTDFRKFKFSQFSQKVCAFSSLPHLL